MNPQSEQSNKSESGTTPIDSKSYRGTIKSTSRLEQLALDEKARGDIYISQKTAEKDTKYSAAESRANWKAIIAGVLAISIWITILELNKTLMK